MHTLKGVSRTDQYRALGLSTFAFTICFAVWTIFSIIGVKIKQDLGLSDTQFGLLVATPVLTGSVSRIFLGVWTEQFGGRVMFPLQMLITAICVWLLTSVQSYEVFLIAALGLGLAGGSFIVGVAYTSRWFKKEHQGTALGIFGSGNVGAAVTNFAAPFLVVALGWEDTARIYAIVLAITAVLFFLLAKTDPLQKARLESGEKPVSARSQLEPLKDIRVWRFATYYFFVFGGFVALASFLPRYYVGAYGLELTTAGVFAGLYSLPGSVFRALGGWMSDKWGARAVMYLTFIVSLIILFVMSYPETTYLVSGINGPIQFNFGVSAGLFVVLTVVLGFVMSLGKAAVYKHIPVYYPYHVGSVGGLVGMIGGLGGFFLPIAFGVLLDLTGVWTAPFMLLFALVAVSTIWMHVAIRRMERARHPGLADEKYLSDLPDKPLGKQVVTDWRPEDSGFWSNTGSAIARRNLWISIPCLLLAFAVWMVWSVVVSKLPVIGFTYTTGELFWLAALPGLSGATLRIFYSFMVPIFGGRVWTTLSTASLLLPALGIGFAVQDPNTSYSWFLILALLCGFGGGNFASSMANIAYFYPKKSKGNALALNAGLGNLGVSVMQFVVPLVITAGVFGALGGEGQTIADGNTIFLQNAGFIWVPFIVVSTIAAWFGMNSIADAKASFKKQSIIFSRKHNWIMCVLYTGTFGSFIGYSAGFPLLMKTQFPEVDALQYAFLGPLVGALSRAGTGWVSDKLGGGRVTFWTFIGMIIAVVGVLQFLPLGGTSGHFWGFFACFMALFFLTGVGNASTFQMIPSIMRQEIPRLMPDADQATQLKQSELESSAIIAFTSAIAAYGAFFIPKAYGTSIALTGGPAGALWCFAVFYAVCVAITWFYYSRKNAPVSC